MKTTEKAEDPELVRQGPTLYPWFFLTLKKTKTSKMHHSSARNPLRWRIPGKAEDPDDTGQGPMLKPLLLAKFHIE